MSLLRRLTILLILFVPACTTAQTGASAGAAVQLRERQWLDAYEQRDAAAMSGILHEKFVITYPNGTRQTRDQVLAFIRAHAADENAPRFHTEQVVAHSAGRTVVLTGIVVTERGQSRTENFYTDTWVEEGGSWRVLASQLAAMPSSGSQ